MGSNQVLKLTEGTLSRITFKQLFQTVWCISFSVFIVNNLKNRLGHFFVEAIFKKKSEKKIQIAIAFSKIGISILYSIHYFLTLLKIL
jgi:hypothetical protein